MFHAIFSVIANDVTKTISFACLATYIYFFVVNIFMLFLNELGGAVVELSANWKGWTTFIGVASIYAIQSNVIQIT